MTRRPEIESNKVILLLPSSTKKFVVQCHGPYTMIKRFNLDKNYQETRKKKFTVYYQDIIE